MRSRCSQPPGAKPLGHGGAHQVLDVGAHENDRARSPAVNTWRVAPELRAGAATTPPPSLSHCLFGEERAANPANGNCAVDIEVLRDRTGTIEYHVIENNAQTETQ